MKVYINKYRNHWLSPYTICEKICFWREIDYDEPWVTVVCSILDPIMTAWMKLLDFIHPQIRYVKIDYWDTWSMDHTLAHIIVPMLKQLRDTKHGYLMVDDEDVPEYLRSYMAQPKEFEWDADALAEARWDWVLYEMIWAFECKLKDDDEHQFFDHSECEGLPIEESVHKLKVDHEGLQKHWDRKKNGYRLFGKYYEALWD